MYILVILLVYGKPLPFLGYLYTVASTQSLHTDGDVNLFHPWGYLGKMQVLRRSSTPTMMDGMIEARATLKSACGRSPEGGGQRCLVSATDFCLL